MMAGEAVCGLGQLKGEEGGGGGGWVREVFHQQWHESCNKNARALRVAAL